MRLKNLLCVVAYRVPLKRVDHAAVARFVQLVTRMTRGADLPSTQSTPRHGPSRCATSPDRPSQRPSNGRHGSAPRGGTVPETCGTCALPGGAKAVFLAAGQGRRRVRVVRAGRPLAKSRQGPVGGPGGQGRWRGRSRRPCGRR